MFSHDPGFGFIPAGAAYVAGRTAITIEASKGTYFTTEQLNKTSLMRGDEYKKYQAFSKFMNIHAEDFLQKELLDLSVLGNKKHLDTRTLFMPFRKVDENIDNVILVSMAQNYGFDSDGNLKRLINLPEGSKSIWELTNLQDGQLNVEGLTDKNYQAFRNGVREVAAADRDWETFNIKLTILKIS